jgi:tRNA dimethylallyltransferase
MSEKLIVVLGPTAVGKTRFAVKLAYKFNGEIISADSRQVYKYMNIGTGKDLEEYSVNNITIPYHLIDIISPQKEYNLFLFQKNFTDAFNKISGKRKLPFLVGGTGLYVHSILKKYPLVKVDFNSPRANELSAMKKPELEKILNSLPKNLHNTTDTIDKERTIKAILIAEAKRNKKTQLPEFVPLVIGITEDRDIIKKRITVRLKTRLKNGMIEEVENLIASGISFEKLNFFGLEYKFVGMYITGKLNYNDMFQKLNSAIHQFAKRQMTWFRKMEKEGIIINWLNSDEVLKAEKLINDFLI